MNYHMYGISILRMEILKMAPKCCSSVNIPQCMTMQTKIFVSFQDDFYSVAVLDQF